MTARAPIPLVLNAYGQARRAVSFLRWEENDVDRYVPSLWSGRGKRRSKRSASERREATVDQLAPQPLERPEAPATQPTDAR